MEREQRGIRLLPGTRCRNHSRAYERGLLVSKLPLCGRSSREFRMEREQRGIRLLPGTRCRNHSRAYERGLLVSKLPLCGRSSREFRMEREWRGVRFPPDERAGAAAVLTNEGFRYTSLRFADVLSASSGWSANGAGFGFRRTSALEPPPRLRTRLSGFRFAGVPCVNVEWSAGGVGFGLRRRGCGVSGRESDGCCRGIRRTEKRNGWRSVRRNWAELGEKRELGEVPSGVPGRDEDEG